LLLKCGYVDHSTEKAMTPEQKRSNRRLGLILASVALTFLIGFLAKIVLLGA